MKAKAKKVEPYSQFKQHARAVDFIASYLDLDPRKVLKNLDRKSKARSKRYKTRGLKRAA